MRVVLPEPAMPTTITIVGRFLIVSANSCWVEARGEIAGGGVPDKSSRFNWNFDMLFSSEEKRKIILFAVKTTRKDSPFR